MLTYLLTNLHGLGPSPSTPKKGAKHGSWGFTVEIHIRVNIKELLRVHMHCYCIRTVQQTACEANTGECVFEGHTAGTLEALLLEVHNCNNLATHVAEHLVARSA